MVLSLIFWETNFEGEDINRSTILKGLRRATVVVFLLAVVSIFSSSFIICL